MKTIEKTFRDFAGKKYEEEILTEEALKDIIECLDCEEIIKKAVENHCDSYGRTKIEMDLRDGSLSYNQYSSNSCSMYSHYITLGVIEQNTQANSNVDYESLIPYAENYDEIEKEENLDSEEIIEKYNLDIESLFWEWFQEYNIDYMIDKEQAFHEISMLFTDEATND